MDSEKLEGPADRRSTGTLDPGPGGGFKPRVP
jgi:hypothetical protein